MSHLSVMFDTTEDVYVVGGWSTCLYISISGGSAPRQACKDGRKLRARRRPDT